MQRAVLAIQCVFTSFLIIPKLTIFLAECDSAQYPSMPIPSQRNCLNSSDMHFIALNYTSLSTTQLSFSNSPWILGPPSLYPGIHCHRHLLSPTSASNPMYSFRATAQSISNHTTLSNYILDCLTSRPYTASFHSTTPPCHYNTYSSVDTSLLNIRSQQQDLVKTTFQATSFP